MVVPERLQELLLAYAEEAKLFFYSYGLANLVVDKTLDHVAVKALDRKTYEQYLEIYKPLAERVTSSKVNDRDLATVVLQNPLDAGTFGQLKYLEIMEPRPGAIATTYDLIDHVEIFTPDLEAIKKQLKHWDVQFSEQSNDAHNTVVVEINEWGQEVKFTDRTLAEIVEQEITNKSAKII